MGETAEDIPALVKKACEDNWEAHKADCSSFVKAVAERLGISVSGQANDIIIHIRSQWTRATSGVDAAAKAAEGKFVIGGLEAEPNGHVVVVVSGPLNRAKYPSAYWGRLGAVGRKNQTINWSWNEIDRDKVEYYYASIDGVAIADARPLRIIGWDLKDALRKSVA
jgi:hypothetical protein